MNPFQFIKELIKNGGDPRQIVIQILSANPNLDNVGKNLLERAQANDLEGATNITRNVANEKGMDVNNVLNNFRNGNM